MKTSTILFFDTSQVGAGVLLSREGSKYTLHAYQTIKFGTTEGDAALEALFTAAAAIKHGHNEKTGVSAEQPCGYDRRGLSIRAKANGVIGVLQSYARRFELPWRGEIAPGTAKKALTGDGRAQKPAMVWYANIIFGLTLKLPADEHAADACGGAMAALSGQYIVRNCGGRTTKAFKEKQREPKGPQGRLL